MQQEHSWFQSFRLQPGFKQCLCAEGSGYVEIKIRASYIKE